METFSDVTCWNISDLWSTSALQDNVTHMCPLTASRWRLNIEFGHYRGFDKTVEQQMIEGFSLWDKETNWQSLKSRSPQRCDPGEKMWTKQTGWEFPGSQLSRCQSNVWPTFQLQMNCDLWRYKDKMALRWPAFSSGNRNLLISLHRHSETQEVPNNTLRWPSPNSCHVKFNVLKPHLLLLLCWFQ